MWNWNLLGINKNFVTSTEEKMLQVIWIKSAFLQGVCSFLAHFIIKYQGKSYSNNVRYLYVWFRNGHILHFVVLQKSQISHFVVSSYNVLKMTRLSVIDIFSRFSRSSYKRHFRKHAALIWLNLSYLWIIDSTLPTIIFNVSAKLPTEITCSR